MNIYKFISVFTLGLFCIPNVYAAIIDFNNLDPDLSNNSGLAGFTPTASISGQVITFSFTQTGDLDGQGVANDTLSFDIEYTAFAGSTIAANGDVVLGNQIAPNDNNINFVQNNFEEGDTLSLQILNVNYVDGEGDGAIQFNGFDAISVTDFGNPATTGTPDGPLDVFVGLAGATQITFDPTNTNLDITANGNSPQLFFTIGENDGPVRLRDVDFVFEIVETGIPEPSTVILVGSLILGSMLGRRRKAAIES